MDIGAVLLALALVTLLAAFLVRPLLQQRVAAASAQHQEASALLAERERILNLLEELEMDLAMNKVAPEDYQRQRSEWVEEGARVLRRLDELGADSARRAPLAADDLGARLEEEIASFRRGPSDASTQFCPECGKQVVAGDQFCASCGASLAEGKAS